MAGSADGPCELLVGECTEIIDSAKGAVFRVSGIARGFNVLLLFCTKHFSHDTIFR